MADQTLTIGINANMNIGNVLSGVKQLQGAFSALKLPANLTANVYKEFEKLQKQLREFQDLQGKTNLGKGDLKTLDKLRSSIDSTYGHLIEEMNELSSKKIILEADATKIKEAEATVKNLQQQIQDKLNKVDLKFEVNKNNTLDIGLNSFVTQLGSASGRSKQFKASLEEIKQAMASGNTSNLGAQISNAINQAQKLKGAGSDVLKVFSQMGIIKLDTKKLEDAEYRAKKFEQALKIISPVLQTLNADTGELKDKLAAAFEVRNTAFETGLKNGRDEVQKINTELDKSRGAADKAGAAFKGMADQTVRAAEEIKQLQQSTQYFFSLRNMINLLKQGLRDAVQTVRDLDAAMTETAVVTNFSVGDMWSKLPEYTANANKLGATIQDMYESTTLYYQQGLNTEQSMAIAAETMKMARIAGLEAKDATDMMTAALRGFNMELNEASATRINDVYSNLAAKTASDTEEIGKAMQRTASIAHSAGMSFEGTAAFLAQAVETTREPAENIGTAMKTIVARFQEMKENPLEITEVDGEEVSYNKVDKALQSIGVSLKDANGQFRELDKVFLDISKRWNGLTQTQQRYIATIAAGSRQQSRFIAMMGDYERTTELMNYATDAEGASQEQFNKTLDSLEAKINKMKNAWDQFLMGIMNDSATKFVVDAGTKVLDIVNKIIDVLSFNGNSGLIKSVLSLGTAFLSLKAGGNILNKLIGGMGGLVDPTTGGFWKGFWGAGKTTPEGTPATGLAGKITTPIVAKLNELIAATKTGNNLLNSNKQVTSTVGEYKNISSLLRNTKSTNMGAIGSLFGQLSDEHAYVAYRNAPGTIDAMRQASLGWLGSKQLPTDAQKVGQQLMKNIFKGMSKKEIPVKDGIKLLGQPQKWGETFGTDVAKNFSDTYTKTLAARAKATALQNAERANQEALKYLVHDPSQYTMGSKALKDFLKNDNMRAVYKERYAASRQKIDTENINFNDTAIPISKYQQFANTIGILGSKFSSAGLSVQMFGSQLGQLHPALQGVGALLTQVGIAINTFGMGISGIGTAITKVSGRVVAGMTAAKAVMATNAASGGMAWLAGGQSVAGAFISGFTGGMSAGPIAAIIAGVLTGGILMAKSIIDKKAKEAGEEVRKNFESGFTETGKKIDSLSDYKNRFNELAQGVDQFGHNINLTAEEYDEYLSISRDLQELSPSLISGYNAEGQAILRKGEALDEVINKLKEERQLSLTDYISNDSLDKLIGEFKTSDAYKEHHTSIKSTSSQHRVVGAFDSDKTNISEAIKKAELEWSDFSQILDELGIGSANSIDELTNRQLSLISDHYTDILNKIKEVNPQIEEEAEEGLKEAFANTSNSIEDVMTEGAPIIESLRQWMGQEKIDAVGLQLSEEFVSGFNSGLDGLMLEGLTNNWKPEQYKAELKDYAKEWEHLAGPTSAYSQVLSEADKIQQQYLDHIGEDGAIEDYENSVEGLAVKLESLSEQYKGTGAAGEVFAEQCQQQANNLRNYATEGVVSLGEALNTLSDEFESARGAQERFQKATESGDYYTAAEGYKSIIDTMLDDKNKVTSTSNGSLAFWAGADELLGQKFVDSHSTNQVVKQVEKIKDCFEDGLPGVQKFGDLLVENANNLKGLGEVNKKTGQFEFKFKNLDDLEKYAEVLGISEDALAALIDKSRQYVAWNLSDPGEIRKAIESSQYSMAGVSTKGENLVYTAESQFRAEARQQNIRGDDYTKTKKDAEERGVRFLNVENLTAKNGEYTNQVLENIGLKGQAKTVENAVAAFAKMGLDLEDTKQILKSDGIKLANGEEATTENIEKAYNEQAYALENPTVSGIASDTGIIATAATAMLAQMGIMTDGMKQDIQNATSNDVIKEHKDSLNQNFTDSKTRNAARQEVENQIADYKTTMHLLEQGGLTDTAEYQALANRSKELTQALEEEASAWSNATLASQTFFDGLGANSQDQDWLNQNAIDVQTVFNTTGLQDGATALAQLKEEGNLSVETIDNLTNKFLALHATELLSMDDAEFARTMNKFGIYGQEIDNIRKILQQPFVIHTQLTGEDLKAYVASIDGLTDEEKSIILKAYVDNSDKVTDLINAINTEFGDGSEETKSIIIQATAKLASGDTEGAHNLLQEQFGNKTEEIESKLNIICDGSIANPEDVKSSIERQIQSLQVNANVKANIETDASKIKLKQTGSINYTTQVDDAAIKNARKSAEKKVTMPIDANTDAADRKIAKLKKPGSATIDVYMRKAGNWTATVTVNERARGQNYSIPAHNSLSFGAAAQGMNLPKKKRTGGSNVTALVGEEGFEVGYIPSESRSIIFGANGPEMTSFPSDTVIYPHKQSKDILRRGKGNHKTLGSFSAGNSGSSGGIPTSKSYTNSASKTTNNKATKKTSQSVQKAAKTIEIISAKAGKVFVWWENMARSVEKAQRDAEKNQKTLERLLKNFGTTLSEYDEASKPYKEALEKQIDLANQRIQKANDELHITDYGADSKKSNDYLAAIGARQEISYEITKTKKKKGKKKTTTETKKETLNLAKYIKLIDGVYQLNQAEIDKVAKSNKSRAEAIKAAAEKQLNDLYSKLKAAEDDRIKAEEALQQFYNDAYEAFSRWDKSITAVYLLSQQLEKLSAEANIYESAVDLQTSKLEAGFAKAIDVLPQITSALERNRDIMIAQVQTNAAKVDAAWKEYSDSLSLRTITEKYLANQSSTDAAYDYDVMKNTLTFLQNAGLDQSNFNLDTAAKALEELYANQWKGDDYEKIKEGLDKIAEKQGDYYSALADTYSSINEVYQKIEEYQSYMADFEGTLIKGIEDQANKQIDRLNKLNSSLSTAAKDIIDEVKRKLDERRKQEDNAKTESEISQKQQRLAALRADTAGGHATEIAQLEKEIADSQQSYGRTLEDQLLDRLSQQQDNAEKQRERQIALLEAQRDFAAATGSNVDQINKWLQDPANYAEEIKSAFLANNNFEELGELERQQLLQEFESKFGTYLAYAEVLPGLVDAASQEWPESISEDVPSSLDGIEDKIDTIIGLLGDGTQLVSELNSDAMTLEEFKEQGADAITARALSTDQGRTYTAKDFINAGYTPTQTKEAGFTATDFKQSDVSYDDAKAAGFTDTQLIEGGYDIPSTSQTETTPSTPAKTDLWKTIQDTFKKLNIDATGGNLSPLGAAALAEAKKHKGAKVRIGSQDARVGGSGEIYWDRKGTVRKWNPSTGKVTTFKYNKATYIKEANKANSPYVYEEFRESLHTRKVKGYKTGGLATQTGPAWLDGTPAKPELVLNAQDTKNFIALKDILAHAMGSTNNINNSYGGNATYEININVDHINNDYDVDKITKRVKENIIKDSSYRNVTQVRKFR